MNYKMIARLYAMILVIEAVFMIPAVCIGFGYGESHAAVSFLTSMAIILAVAGIFALLSKNAQKTFRAKEGLVCVGTSWILMSLLGCLPFFLSREIPSYIDALFEIVSGFTTTGASILSDVEALSKCLLYWRSFSHWVGGMGVLVFLLALVPMSGKNEGFTMHLLRAESPGPDVGKLVPKMKQTAMVLYLTYVALTVLNFLFLIIGNMPLFDAVCTAFGTAGTGGFGVKNDSIAGYSPYLQNVCTVFMLLFGINFSCFYLLILRQFRAIFRDEELRLYLGVVAVAILLITLDISGLYDSIGESLRYAAFQVSSIITTTGFSTVNFDAWPAFSKGILLVLMLIGACAGSTGGGIKCARILLLIKGVRRNISQIMHPQKVQVIRVNGKVVDERILSNTNSYLAVYLVIMVVSFLVVGLDEFSITTNFSAVMACFNNIGPGLDAAGPTCNFSIFSPLSKIVLIFDMLAGRLEIFPILILLSPKTWSRS